MQVVTMTNKRIDVMRTLQFGRDPSSFKTSPNAIAPLIIPAKQMKTHWDSSISDFILKANFKKYKRPITDMNRQLAATKISPMQNGRLHSKSLYEKAVNPIYTKTKASAANPTASTETEELILL